MTGVGGHWAPGVFYGQDVDFLMCKWVRIPLVLVWLHKDSVQIAGGSGTQVGSQLIYLCVCVSVCM